MFCNVTQRAVKGEGTLQHRDKKALELFSNDRSGVWRCICLLLKYPVGYIRSLAFQRGDPPANPRAGYKYCSGSERRDFWLNR